MSETLIRTLKPASRALAPAAMFVLFFFLVPGTTRAQSWSWTYDLIDLPAKFPSLAVDSNSNLHVSYADSNGALKYGFRPAGSAKWFFMVLDKQLGSVNSRLALDSNDNPHICYTPGIIKYARFDGKQWQTTQIDRDSGEVGYTCSIVVSKEGVPSLAWYQLWKNILHIRYAILQENAWMARTLDFDFETGKWNSMVLDAQGKPFLAYSAWFNGELRVARWNGKQWEFTTVDSRVRSPGEYNIGQGNSLVLDPSGKAHISYYSEKTLKYAQQVGEDWKTEVVDQITWLGGWIHFRSSIVLDKRGFPHICYEDAGVLKHAYSDGKQWHIQVLARNGGGVESMRYSSMAIDRDDRIYVAFRDPQDNTLRLATGHLTPQQQDAASGSGKDEKHAAPPTKE
jgi:hypothetical protein